METDIQFEILSDFLVWRNNSSATAALNIMPYDSAKYTLGQDVVQAKFDE